MEIEGQMRKLSEYSFALPLGELWEIKSDLSQI